ncbi:MAG: DUF4159 domain-containing protein [Verrucomicrobia bacterium]|nr:DUF4159 domain-containing protein [Verrucomicrobiota bacterium]MDA1086159.1 DUF4159 domain-containing protein [Verrucomicrobiota bacterium]
MTPMRAAALRVLLATYAGVLPADDEWVIRQVPALDPVQPVALVSRSVDGDLVTTSSCEMVTQGTNHWAVARLSREITGVRDLKLVTTTEGGPQGSMPLGRHRVESGPSLDVVIAIDTSGSMKRNDPLNLRYEAVQRFFTLARNSGRFRSVSLIGFSRRSNILLAPTAPADVNDLAPYLAQLAPGGATNFDRPFRDALRILETRQGEKAVLFLSDGFPRIQYDDTHLKLKGLNAPVYAVGLSAEADARLLGAIATDTGGRFFSAPDSAELGGIFSQIFQLIDRPTTLLKASRELLGEHSEPLIIDPFMRNAQIEFSVVHGHITIRIAGTEHAMTRDSGSVSIPLDHLPPGEHTLQMSGKGRIVYQISATSSLEIYTVQPVVAGPAGLALHWANVLSRPELCRNVSLQCRIANPDGTTSTSLIQAGHLAGLYLGHAAAESEGVYRAEIRATGTVDGHRFVRGANITFSRTGGDMARHAGAPIHRAAVQQDQSTARDVSLAAVRNPGAIATDSPIFWAKPAEFSVTDLYPGSTVTATVSVLINTPLPDRALHDLAGPSRHDGIDYATEGTILPNQSSLLSMIVSAGDSTAGQSVSNTVRVRTGGSEWMIPVTGRVAAPEIRTVMTDAEFGRRESAVVISNRIAIALSPDGRSPLTVRSKIAGLRILPSSLAASSATNLVHLVLRVPFSEMPRLIDDVVVLEGPGIATVTLRYIADTGLPPGEVVRAPIVVRWLSAPWARPLLLVLIIALALILSHLRANRRMAFLCASGLVHLIALFIVLPDPDRNEEQAPVASVIRLTGADSVVEEQIAPETPEITDNATDPSESEIDKAELETKPEDPDSSREVETEEDMLAEIADPEPLPEEDHEVQRPEQETVDLDTPLESVERKTVEETPEVEIRELEQEHARVETMTPEEAVTPQEVTPVTLEAPAPDADAVPIEQPVERSLAQVMTVEPEPTAPVERKHAEQEPETPEEQMAHQHAKIEPILPKEIATPQDVSPTTPEAPSPDADAIPVEQKVERSLVHVMTVETEEPEQVERKHRRDVEPVEPLATPNAATPRTDEQQPDMADVSQPVEHVSPEIAPVNMDPVLTQEKRKSVKRTPSDHVLQITTAVPESVDRKKQASPRITAASAAQRASSPVHERIEPAAVDESQTLAEPSWTPAPVTAPRATPRRTTKPVRREASETTDVASPSQPVVRRSADATAPNTVTNSAMRSEPARVQIARAIPTTSAEVRSSHPKVSVSAPVSTTAAIQPEAKRSVPTARPSIVSVRDVQTPATPATRPRRTVVAPASSTPRVMQGVPRRIKHVSPRATDSTRPLAPSTPSVEGPRPTATLRSSGPTAPAPKQTALINIETVVARTEPAPPPREIPDFMGEMLAPLGATLPPEMRARQRPDLLAPYQPAPWQPPAPELSVASVTPDEILPPAKVALGARKGLIDTAATGGTLPLLKYDGDWDCDDTAMLNLAYQMEQRTGSLLPIGTTTIGLDDERIGELPFIFMTGHDPFRMSEDEVKQLSKYLAGGGYMWINDSTDISDDRFDHAVRRELARVLPDLKWKRIPMTHNLFKGPYDLTRGFKGYAVPPGDKYRLDYLEGLYIGDRLAIVYTRNDYGDGLEINPNTHPLMPSLSDLSPHDMQEGSIRMGINIVMHFLNKGQPPTATMQDKVQSHGDHDDLRASLSTLPPLPFELMTTAPSWAAPDDWGDTLPAVVTAGPDNSLSISFGSPEVKTITRRSKVVALAAVDITLSNNRALLLDVDSQMPGGCRLALAFAVGETGAYVESAPAYIRPGKNSGIVFDLRAKTFKSEVSEWQYNLGLGEATRIHDWHFIIYPQSPSGSVTIQNVRIVQPPVAAP